MQHIELATRGRSVESNDFGGSTEDPRKKFEGFLLREPLDERIVNSKIFHGGCYALNEEQHFHLVADRQIKNLLHPTGLREIPDAGASAGGVFRANPSLDLRVAAERQEQVDDWLRQLGLDAGLTGMEGLIESYRAKTTPRA